MFLFLFFDGVSEGSLKTLEDNQVYIVKFKDAFAINNLLINAEILTPLSDSDAFITTPRGTTWRNIKITLEQDEEHCEISIGSETHSYKYNNPKLGNGVFLDKRTKKPNKLWKLLMEFAKNSGNIRWQKGGYTKDGLFLR
ncbi:MAG: hypothetical protein HY762_06945 [Planctomycetes bacterium]|nr:hypothetical protein [Planctomycetota bacterium]